MLDEGPKCWPWVIDSSPQWMLCMGLTCLMGPGLELELGTSVVPFYLKAPQFILMQYFVVHLEVRSLSVVSIVVSVFRQKPHVSSSVWGMSDLCSLKLQVEG